MFSRFRATLRLLLLVAAAPLALLLAACSDPAEPEAPDPENARTWELRPQWIPGETITVREEQWQYRGRGSFPGMAEIESRAETTTRSVDVYDIGVIEATGSQLSATERTYRSSFDTGEDGFQPTVVSGRKYLVKNPFGAIRIRRLKEDGTDAKLVPEEQAHVSRFGLRIAASLVPGEPVPQDVTWKPGRSLEALAIRGGSGVRMIARLARIEEENGRRTAVVIGETDSRVRVERNVEANLSIRETLRIDVDRWRFESYRSETDWRYPPYRGKPEKWRRTVLTVTLK